VRIAGTGELSTGLGSSGVWVAADCAVASVSAVAPVSPPQPLARTATAAAKINALPWNTMLEREVIINPHEDMHGSVAAV
jgi:hypothetical protein